MEELLSMEEIVRDTLENHPDTRNSDALLYITIINQISPRIAKKSYEDVMLRANEMGLPNYESIARVRRKLQAENEALRASIKVTNKRYGKWKVYREYALQ